MKTCAFFGHRDYYEESDARIYDAVKKMVLQKGVDNFYIGHNGKFDKAALRVVQRIAAEYKHVRYAVVLTDPGVAEEWRGKNVPTVFPRIVAESPARFRIDRRNRFMLSASDCAITYVKRPFGGAAKYKSIAVKKGICVIEISE